MSNAKLTDGCWDCECKEHYIHAKIRTMKCDVCGVHADDQPDSHVEEVLAMPASFRMTGSEYAENVGLCPFCFSSEIEGGADTSFEDNTVFSSCDCHTCGSSWRESYTLDGWIEENESGPDEWHGDTRMDDKIKALEEERDKLRAALAQIANFVKDGDSDPEASESCGEEVEVELSIDEAYKTTDNCITIARAALGMEA